MFRLYGASMREARVERGLTQSGLARHAGVSVSMVNDIEAEKRRPSIDMLCRLAPPLGMTPAQLLDRLLSPPRTSDPMASGGEEQRPGRDCESRKEAAS